MSDVYHFYGPSASNEPRDEVSDEQEPLADQRVFRVSEESWSAVIDMLDAPPRPRLAVMAVAVSKAPWEA